MSAEAKDVGSVAVESNPKRRKINRKPNALNEKGFSECFRVVRTSMYVSLAPCHINNPINGVKAQHLDPLIMKYFPKARGIVLSYFNISFPSKDASNDALSTLLAKITDSSAFAFTWIDVDLLIWHPQAGDVLEGFVYMQTASHIGLLIHDTFNASIKYRNIPQDWEFVPNQADEFTEADSENNVSSSKFKSFGHWVDGSGVKVEGRMSFNVKSIYTSGRMISLEGTLLSPESELDAQPVSSEQIGPKSESIPVVKGKHITFDDEANVDANGASEINSEAGVDQGGASGDIVNSSSSEEEGEESD